MKKAALAVIALAAVVALGACGSTSKVKTVTVASKAPPPVATTPPATATTPPAQTSSSSTPCSTVTPGDGNITCNPEGSTTCPAGWTMVAADCLDSTPDSSDSSDGSGDSSPASNTVMAGPGQWLKLDTLHAKVEHVSITHEESDQYLGVKTAHGKFVVISLAVTNHSDSPQSFDDLGDEDALVLGNGKTYTERFDVINGYDQNSFTSQNDPIQPDQTTTHDVIFDVPSNAVVSGATLAVLNFGDDVNTYSADDGTQVGTMALGTLS